MARSATYERRNVVLGQMGYATYADYLLSELWIGIRARVMDRDHGVCRVCARKAVSVHHITYEQKVMRGEDLSQLIAICRGCHKRIEFDDDGAKLLSSSKVAARLHERAGKTRKRSRVKAMRPRCRCCQKQVKALGRDDICMTCYRSGAALRFRQGR